MRRRLGRGDKEWTAITIAPTRADTDDEWLVLPTEGMTCASCVGRVEQAIRKVPGVTDVSVNLATEKAEVTFGRGTSDAAGVADAVFKAGYMLGSTVTELSVSGLTCASCVGRLEKALQAVPGVLKATVNLATETARVEAVGAAAPDRRRREGRPFRGRSRSSGLLPDR